MHQSRLFESQNARLEPSTPSRTTRSSLFNTPGTNNPDILPPGSKRNRSELNYKDVNSRGLETLEESLSQPEKKKSKKGPNTRGPKIKALASQIESTQYSIDLVDSESDTEEEEKAKSIRRAWFWKYFETTRLEST